MAARSIDLRPESVPADKAPIAHDRHYNSTRYSWRPTPTQLQAIAHLRFKDETFDPFINRILRQLVSQLQAAGAIGVLEVTPIDEVKLQPHSFRADIMVGDWIEQQKERGYTRQGAIDWMLEQATLLEPVKELRTQTQVLGAIKKFLKGKDRALLVDLLSYLSQQCPEERARQRVKELATLGAIVLVVGEGSGRIHLPGDNRQYKFVQLKTS